MQAVIEFPDDIYDDICNLLDNIDYYPTSIKILAENTSSTATNGEVVEDVLNLFKYNPLILIRESLQGAYAICNGATWMFSLDWWNSPYRSDKEDE